MGCTGRGIPNTTPVAMLKKPEKTSVVEREMEPFTASVIMSGSNVPRSPSAPEISASGELRRVATLLRWKRLMFEEKVMVLAYWVLCSASTDLTMRRSLITEIGGHFLVPRLGTI